MKRFTKTVFDGLRSSVQATKEEIEEIQIVETLQADAFQIAKVIVTPVHPARISLIVQDSYRYVGDSPFILLFQLDVGGR